MSRRLLVVAFSSARMIAELAAADGWDVVAVDRFADRDLRAVAQAQCARGSAAITARAVALDADAVVYGGGLENRPDLVARLAAGRELLGVAPEALAAVRDPWALGAALRATGAAMPETRPASDPPGRPDGGGWVRKPIHGGAGRGVRGWAGGRLRASEIVQRRVDGLPVSAVAVGDGRRARLLGITEQLLAVGSYAWIGNVTPPRLSPGERESLGGQLSHICDAVTARFAVAGTFGVDAVWDGHRAWALEVNPRPTAALELFEAGTFAAHVAGVRGILSDDYAAHAGTRARMKLVLFADRDLRAPSEEWWPERLVRDVPRAGLAIARGEPVCTLIGDGDDVSALQSRGASLLSALPGRPVVAHG